ncbi:MAG: hypothetical protein J6R32_04375 [Bacteroidales bacterium]|nr:hypothetical protein [Bacteroidales bacterium]
MKVNQIASILNTLNEVMVGTEAVFSDDLSNIVDAGAAVLDYTSAANGANFDNYIGKLIDQVGRIIFVDRAYTSQAPDIMKDSWEYGSILMKVRAELMDAKNNSTWQLGEIENGTGLSNDQDAGGTPITPSRLDPFVLNKPNVNAKFYNKRVTYEVPISLAREQLKEAFRSASEMSRFFAMIENRIRTKRILCTDALVMATIRNLIGNKVASGKAINILPLYNATVASPIQAADFWTNPEAIRYANKTISLYKKYMAAASTLYNEGNYITYTPSDRLKAVFLAEFVKDAEVYLYSDTFHNEYDKIDGYSEVGYWQGSGEDDSLSSRSTVMGTFVTNDEKNINGGIDGVIAVLFDEEAAAVCCENDRVTSIYNPRAEYTNYFYKWDALYMNDLEENCVVFYVSDSTVAGALPTTAPASSNTPITITQWNTDYAIADSPYSVWDDTTEQYVALTADDKTTAAGYDWTKYAGKSYLYTPST